MHVAKSLLCLGVIAACSSASVALSGCGYRISSHGDGGETVGDNRDSQPIRLDTVENQVSPPRPGLEYEFTRRLKDEMALDRRFELSTNASKIVRVVLTEYREPALVRDFGNVQTEVALSVKAMVRVDQPGQPRRSADVAAHTSFAPGRGESKDAGLERLWRNLARNVIDRLDDRDWTAEPPAPPESASK